VSNANTATSIAAITLCISAVDSIASARCRCKVSPRALISSITRSVVLAIAAVRPPRSFTAAPRIE
jgi:hypothetical protein